MSGRITFVSSRREIGQETAPWMHQQSPSGTGRVTEEISLVILAKSRYQREASSGTLLSRRVLVLTSRRLSSSVKVLLHLQISPLLLVIREDVNI